MSYFGAEFPEGVDPEKYQEILSIEDILCPLFRRGALKALNSNFTTTASCSGCDTPDAFIMYLDSDYSSERLFVRRNSPCTHR